MKIFLFLFLNFWVFGCASYEKPAINHDIAHNEHDIFTAFSGYSFPKEHLDALQKENFDLQKARLNLQKLGLIYEQQFGAQMPQVGLGFSANRNKTEFLAFQGQRLNDALVVENYTTALNASFDLDPFGVLRSTKAQAKKTADAAAYNYAALMLTQKANYIKNFHTLYFSSRDIEIAEKNLEIAKRNLKLVDFRYNSGLLPLSNVLSARQNMQSAKAIIENKKEALLLAESAYALLLGQERVDAKEIDLHFAPVPDIRIEQDFTISLDHIDNRPDVMAARKTLEAAYDGADASLARMFPSVELTVSFSNIATEFSKAFTKQNLASNFAASLAQVLFDGGRLYKGLQIAETDAEIAKVSYKEAVMKAINQTENSFKLFKQAQNILQANQNNYKSASQNLKIATESYENGRMTLMEYLDIQTRHYNAETNLLIAQRGLRDRYTNMLVQLNIQPFEEIEERDDDNA